MEHQVHQREGEKGEAAVPAALGEHLHQGRHQKSCRPVLSL